MDATVPQRDGFRFVYVLPFAPDRLLIEDTYYSDRLELDVAATRELVAPICRPQGWTIAEVLREETGVLPIALGGDIEAFWAEAAGVPRSGLRAALFHPTTGYSLPRCRAPGRHDRGACPTSARQRSSTPPAHHSIAAWNERRLLPPARPHAVPRRRARVTAIGCWSGSTGFRRG